MGQKFQPLPAAFSMPAKRGDLNGSMQHSIDHHGDTIVRAAYDGEYDKTNLPDRGVAR
jgi:hypothetical protein